jgi:hypothetical protein
MSNDTKSQKRSHSLHVEAGVLDDGSLAQGFELVLRIASLVVQVFSTTGKARKVQVKGKVKGLSEVVLDTGVSKNMSAAAETEQAS